MRNVLNKQTLNMLFPQSNGGIETILKTIYESLYANVSEEQTRFPSTIETKELIKKYSEISLEPDLNENSINHFVKDFWSNVPRWKSGNLQYNVGSAPNAYATAIYALALEENIINASGNLAGNALVAEKAVANILGDLAQIRTSPAGIFSFGGTATNLYAMRIGIKKCCPESTDQGVGKDVYAVITEDGHFCHKVAAEWLGIGLNRVITIKAKENRTSDIADAEQKIRTVLMNGGRISTIIVNGGTTYDQAIDDIKSFKDMIDRLVKEYNLSYRPHLHVDSVIGWSWLFLSKYDFDENTLDIEEEALGVLKSQFNRISAIQYADSWGVDFHKGIGSCPVDCSAIIFNNSSDLQYLMKDKSVETHHLAKDEYSESPVDYTLETSRSAGPSLSALISLRTFGVLGYIQLLANLVSNSILLRKKIRQNKDIKVLSEEYNKGFVTMLRLYPKASIDKANRFSEISSSVFTAQESLDINKYMKGFFNYYEKLLKESLYILPNFSISSKYITAKNGAPISAIKLYPVSPHYNNRIVDDTVKLIRKLKDQYDELISLDSHNS